MSSAFFIAYASSASRSFPETELSELLAVSRKNNSLVDVSGLLLYRGGNFLQALEGPEEAVKSTMLRIAQDQRHRSVVQLYEGWNDGRLFPDWAMAFEQARDVDITGLPGFSSFLAEPQRRGALTAFERDNHEVVEFFHSFRELIR